MPAMSEIGLRMWSRKDRKLYNTTYNIILDPGAMGWLHLMIDYGSYYLPNEPVPFTIVFEECTTWIT